MVNNLMSSIKIQQTWIRLALDLLVCGAVFARGVLDGIDTNTWLSLLGAEALLIASEPFITARWPGYTPVYLLGQTVLIGSALLNNDYEYVAVLFVILSAQTMRVYPSLAGLHWVGLFCVVIMVNFMIATGIDFGFILSLIYIGAIALVVSAVWGWKVANQTRDELQQAHQDLKDYAVHVEALSTMQERDRLARELHDSVTQTIFGMMLNAESAQTLYKRIPDTPDELGILINRLQEQAQAALTEMRLLVSQMRRVDDDLILVLRQHIAGLARHSNLHVNLRTEHELSDLTSNQQQEIFRIIQEALNNVIKHAATNRAEVRLTGDLAGLHVTIEDQGCGFDITDPAAGLGILGMRERATALGGQLRITTAPQHGTRITINIPKENA